MDLNRLSLAAAVTLCLTATSVRATETVKPGDEKKPRIELPETFFAFGYAPQNASISHVFWLKNTGGDTLRISDVRTG